MNSTPSRLRSAALAAGLTLILAACASGGPQPPSPALLQKIENARTRADHEDLVAYYERAASEAKAKAEEHRKMGRAYLTWQATGKSGGSSMYSHCNGLVERYTRAAEEYSAMAALHRQLAGQTTP